MTGKRNKIEIIMKIEIRSESVVIARGLLSSVTRRPLPLAVARDSFCLDCAENSGDDWCWRAPGGLGKLSQLSGILEIQWRNVEIVLAIW